MANWIWGLIVVLVVLWLLGFFVTHTAGNLIHILIVAAIILLVYQLVAGRNA
jgi:hypothetical protein